MLLLIAGMVACWPVLAQRSRARAQEKPRRQTQTLHGQALVLQSQAAALGREVASHQRTDAQPQPWVGQADAASQAKRRFITAMSHEP